MDKTIKNAIQSIKIHLNKRKAFIAVNGGKNAKQTEELMSQSLKKRQPLGIKIDHDIYGIHKSKYPQFYYYFNKKYQDIPDWDTMRIWDSITIRFSPYQLDDSSGLHTINYIIRPYSAEIQQNFEQFKICCQGIFSKNPFLTGKETFFETSENFIKQWYGKKKQPYKSKIKPQKRLRFQVEKQLGFEDY